MLSLAIVGLGTFAMAQNTQGKKIDKAEWQQKQDAKLQEMKQELGLSDAQVAQIKELKNKKASEHAAKLEATKEERAKKVADMKQQKEEMDKEMKAILTPEQYTKWQAIRAEKMKERKENAHKKDFSTAK